MTSKEKAKELYNKFYYRLPSKMDNIDKVLYSKQFSIIAVDLIIYHTEDYSSTIHLYEFYLEVKKEIELL
jgi:hypothetical protein